MAYDIRDALNAIQKRMAFAAYVIDPAFEFDDGKPEQDSGFTLARRIAQSERSTESIWLVSYNNSLLEQATKHGFTRLYHRNNYVPNLYKSMDEFFYDLQKEMMRGRLSDI